MEGGLSKRDLWLEFPEVLQASGPQLSLSNQRGCTRKAEGSRVGGGSPLFCFFLTSLTIKAWFLLETQRVCSWCGHRMGEDGV